MASSPHIYLITNIINNKIYIGQTNGTSKSYLGGGRNVEKAQKKYGRRNFTKNILRSFDNDVAQKEMDFWEIFYIDLLSSRNKKIGYNIETGGKGGKNRRNHTPEAVEKIKVRSNQEDNKVHIREIQKIAASDKIGIRRTEEEKIKIAIGKYGNNRIIEIYNKDGSLFDTCITSIQASKLTSIGRSAISNNLVGYTNSTRKYIFKYKII